eukprot:CAMPEP_0116938954 /NCGR_PEP_ID=MMETSP0467-20121206/32445_1 /TAXON_ID=283647 /ORGANISM="Mesodinium pulex, Strain SPMC105" /LENGTH=144 /DNA_ID=CAMNT_0004621135 /DNA_START=965 /DNA_END=1399 /DNA_ORIENTATION=+
MVIESTLPNKISALLLLQPAANLCHKTANTSSLYSHKNILLNHNSIKVCEDFYTGYYNTDLLEDETIEDFYSLVLSFNKKAKSSLSFTKNHTEKMENQKRINEFVENQLNESLHFNINNLNNIDLENKDIKADLKDRNSISDEQ